MSTKTITHWQKDQQFKSYHGKNEIKIDGKREDGFGAKALVLSAIAACSGIDIVDILSKMRIEFSDFEIETLRAGLDHRNAQPHPYLVVGERARIRKGPLSGMEGILVSIKNSLRVVLTINEIAQSVSVEVDSDDIERIYAKASASAVA